jgi:predicted phosphodiesterase
MMRTIGAISDTHGLLRRLEREPPCDAADEIDGFRIYVLHILAELDP